ncbi:hypothetical protein ACFV0C_05260 [Streptomyces sp. NPDC059568]|uniref:hypothetical protein n=1 Tax=Streptomyces sp. NPDC059568 TaxID=3346868 RepID=UPI0036C849A4
MLATTLAILGTLLGAIVSGAFTLRTAGRAERVARQEQLRRDRLDAVIELATRVSDHRRTMWKRGNARLKGAPAERYEELRDKSHDTRGTVTRPLVAVRILIPDPVVRTAADEMITATYAMRDAFTSSDELTAARTAAMLAHDRFVDTVAAYFDHS